MGRQQRRDTRYPLAKTGVVLTVAAVLVIAGGVFVRNVWRAYVLDVDAETLSEYDLLDGLNPTLAIHIHDTHRGSSVVLEPATPVYLEALRALDCSYHERRDRSLKRLLRRMRPYIIKQADIEVMRIYAGGVLQTRMADGSFRLGKTRAYPLEELQDILWPR